jgi:Cu+-exporting ATPase
MPSETLNLRVNGMSCDNCARTIEKKLGSTPGVTKVTVNLAGAAATVEYDIDLVKPEAIANVVRSLGYEVNA